MKELAKFESMFTSDGKIRSYVMISIKEYVMTPAHNRNGLLKPFSVFCTKGLLCDLDANLFKIVLM